MSEGIVHKNNEAIVSATNVDFKIREELLWELFTQTGPVVSVFMPRDRVTGDHQGYAFIEFRNEIDAEYTIKILNGVKLHGKALKLSQSSTQKKLHDIGANVFVGNLDLEVTDQRLYDTFSAFGPLLSCKLMKDPLTGTSKGVGLLSYDSFEAADMAIETMNEKFFANKIIKVNYAYKRDSNGEQYGSVAERLLAANRPIVSNAQLELGSEIHIPSTLKSKIY